MARRAQPIESNGSGGSAAAQARRSFSDVARAHWHWDVELDPDAPERPEARRDFEAVLAEFERTEVERIKVERGHLADDYWCQREASGVGLAEFWVHRDVLPRFGVRRLAKWLRLWHPVPHYRIYRQTDWVTVEYPQLANLLHECDVLAVKAHWGLEGIYQAVVLPWLMSVEKHVLGFIESEWRRGGGSLPTHPGEAAAPAATAETRAARTRRWHEEGDRKLRAVARIEKFCREIQQELSRIEDYYQRAGEKQARLHYLTGMVLFGLVIVALAGLASAGALAAFGVLDLHDAGVRRFYACMAAGAVGAIVSVLIRMGGYRGGFNIDHELGSSGVRRLGAMRPLIGAMSGIAVSLIVQTSLVPIRHGALTFEFYVVAAFLAGFSERWTKVVLDGAMRTITKVDDDQHGKKAPPPAVGSRRN
jgi:hypothetical protein